MRLSIAALTIALAADPYAPTRTRMVQEIADDARYTSRETGRPALDPRVMNALRTIPRHLFVPENLRSAAYVNRPLPIGHGQTISQPYIVALMTDLLRVDRDDVVLEVRSEERRVGKEWRCRGWPDQ